MPDTNEPKSILMRAPVTMNIGPIPEDVTSSSGIMSFGINNFVRILAEKGIKASVDGQFAIGTFGMNGEAAKSQTFAGITLNDRAFRIQPAGDQHQLEISSDLGTSFDIAGTFPSYDFANLIGSAWVDGRIEKAEA